MNEVPSAKRRNVLLMGGVAALAAAGGAGVAWWKGKNAETTTQASQALWGLQFSRPEGGELAMASFKGQPLVINFWATWCAPCIKEMPQLNRFHQTFGPRGWQVVGIALDQAEPVRMFLSKVPVGFPVGLGGMQGSDLAAQMGNDRGALPFTVMLDTAGNVHWHRLGETNLQELSRQAEGLTASAKP